MRRLAGGLLVAVLAVAGGVPATPAVAAGPAVSTDADTTAATPRLRLVPQPSGTPGQVLSVRVVLDGVTDLAGFEVAVTVGGAEMAAASAAAPDGGDLTIPELRDRAVLAAFTPGTRGAAGTPGRGSGSGSVVLGEVRVRPTQPGVIEVRTGRAELVDASGRRALTAPATAWVPVAGGTARHPAPAVPPGAGAAGDRDGGLVDLNGDGRIDAMDLTELALIWETAHVDGSPCGAPGRSVDLDGDRCVTVSDVQRAASTPEASVPPAPPASRIAAVATTLTVDSVADTPDRRIGDGVCATSADGCTLRAAIQEANATPGANTVTFAIPGSGVHTIAIASKLPTIADTSGPTTIDGYTQPGASPNTDPVADDAVITVAVTGTISGGSSGYGAFAITSGGNTVRGLSVYAVRRPFWIFRSQAAANVIAGNFVGTDPAATFVMPEDVLIGHGVHVEQDAAGNRIGGTAPADRNVISGNGRHGVGLWHGNTDGTVVQGNIVGLSPMGDRAVPNRAHGVDLNFGVSETVVGGTGPGEANVVSGNINTGVEVSHTSATTANLITGNLIGTDLTGTAVLPHTPNLNVGVWIEDGASANVVEHNVIAGNAKGAFQIINGGQNGVSTGNVIRYNHVGETATGAPLPSPRTAIWISASGNTIGPGNVIAHHEGAGIRSEDPTAVHNTFTQNAIFDNTSIGIDLGLFDVTANDRDDADTGPNDLLNFPRIRSASTARIAGTACAGCTVELFLASPPETPRSGVAYRASTVAGPDGTWSAPNPGFTAGDRVTATATDPAGNTSEFATPTTVELKVRRTG